jgi:hypothetical protein
LDKVADENLDEVFNVVKQLAVEKPARRTPNLLARLSCVKIQAPADFAANLDLYVSGAKRVPKIS